MQTHSTVTVIVRATLRESRDGRQNLKAASCTRPNSKAARENFQGPCRQHNHGCLTTSNSDL
eukprot:3478174-Amphidinium_carterae.1